MLGVYHALLYFLFRQLSTKNAMNSLSQHAKRVKGGLRPVSCPLQGAGTASLLGFGASPNQKGEVNNAGVTNHALTSAEQSSGRSLRNAFSAAHVTIVSTKHAQPVCKSGYSVAKRVKGGTPLRSPEAEPLVGFGAKPQPKGRSQQCICHQPHAPRALNRDADEVCGTPSAQRR